MKTIKVGNGAYDAGQLAIAATVAKRDIEKAKAWIRRNMTFEKTNHGWSGEDNQTGEATEFYPYLYQAVAEAIDNRLEQMARN